MFRNAIRSILPIGTLLVIGACAQDSEPVPDVPAEETTSQVAELDAVHEVMAPMWHEAFPAQDYAAIQAAVPEFEPLLTALDSATLPGILQDKQGQWDEGKARLMESFQELRSAAEAGEGDAILGSAEAFHMNYEALVRVIRPVVPELDTFHQHLYGLYHYYGPGYDLEKIRRAADAMAADIPPLQAAQLPARLEGRQEAFATSVAELGNQVAALLLALEDPSRDEVEAAIEAVHEAYEAVEGLFD
ncbi:MAG: hypothetical protein ACWGSQ_12520 [Longimicrobiales bacterium]